MRSQTSSSGQRTLFRLLSGVLVLQGLTLAALWKGDAATTARADIPDGGVAERRAANDELRALNAKMERLLTVVESGRLQVRVAPNDDAKPGR